MELIALMPWWAGVGLGLLSYALLHWVAAQPITASARPGQMTGLVTQGLWHGVASVGQYIVPILCLAGAGMSAWKRKVRKGLVADATRSEAADVLDGMTWRQFEVLVGEGFRLKGYQVVETGGGGADGGVDLVLSKQGTNGAEKFLVQVQAVAALSRWALMSFVSFTA